MVPTVWYTNTRRTLTLSYRSKGYDKGSLLFANPRFREEGGRYAILHQDALALQNMVILVFQPSLPLECALS